MTGTRLFAGDGRSVWTLSASGWTWVQLPLAPAGRFLVPLPSGRIVAVDKGPGGSIVEIAAGP